MQRISRLKFTLDAENVCCPLPLEYFPRFLARYEIRLVGLTPSWTILQEK
ncbi:Uncharacterised protein [Salmonella enterica subsp. enterica serovar Goldcoast]|nr:Uncharacterised protein [Salmonella enterica subsp. enterica serovar Goldcoast]